MLQLKETKLQNVTKENKQLQYQLTKTKQEKVSVLCVVIVLKMYHQYGKNAT